MQHKHASSQSHERLPVTPVDEHVVDETAGTVALSPLIRVDEWLCQIHALWWHQGHFAEKRHLSCIFIYASRSHPNQFKSLKMCFIKCCRRFSPAFLCEGTSHVVSNRPLISMTNSCFFFLPIRTFSLLTAAGPLTCTRSVPLAPVAALSFSIIHQGSPP